MLSARVSLLMSAIAVAATATIGVAPAARAQTIAEFTIPTGASSPTEITVGPDGAMWFTEQGANQIGRISVLGVFQEYPVTTANSGPYGIVAGPDGNLWFTENKVGKIGKITTTGTVTEYTLPVAGSLPVAITVGTDGNLWFNEQGNNKIGRITTNGALTEFTLPTAGSQPIAIRPGSDGNLWFTETGTDKIGRITTLGVITEFPAGSPAGASLRFITPFPNGGLVFTEAGTDQLAAIDILGQIQGRVSFPSANAGAFYAALGPDGGVWFTEPNVNKLARLKPGSGNPTFQEYAIPTASSSPSAVAAGPDGKLWFTEQNGNKIGQLTPPDSGPPIVAAVLPASRSVQTTRTATAFATIINATASALSGCGIVPLTPVAARLDFQTTSAATNAAVGAANTRVSIPGNGSQSFTFSLTPGGSQVPRDVALGFACDNADPARIIFGVDTFQYSAATTPTPDMIALALTSSGDGVVSITGTSGTGAFAVATANVGAADFITAIVEPSVSTMNVDIRVCKTKPDGSCILAAASAAYGPVQISANETSTYSVFVTATGAIPFAPATNRIFIRFRDSNKVYRGSTSVAIRTQ